MILKKLLTLKIKVGIKVLKQEMNGSITA